MTVPGHVETAGPTSAHTKPTSGVASVAQAATAWEATFRAQVALMRRLSADDIWHPVSMREYDVLFTLVRNSRAGMRLHELNKEILLSQPSLSRMVDRLVARGLVTKGAVANDRRGSWIQVTDSGRAVQQQIGRAHVARIAHYVGSALTPQEQMQLEALTTKLRLAQQDIPDFPHDSNPQNTQTMQKRSEDKS